MRICVLLEGCYPYVTGGVSSWIHQYIQGMPEHEFVIWAIGATSENKGKFKYTLPENVVEVNEVFLNDALTLPMRNEKYRFNEEEKHALKEFINCRKPDWELIFKMYHERKVSPIAFLMSEEFLRILEDICREEYPYTAFADLFHTVRSMLLPVLYMMGQEIPKADIYHSIATGYSGVLASMAGYVYNVPFMITEHGIYTREREEEIIRAKWVLPAFKRMWVKYFYMLSDAAYSRATLITSLFGRAREIQIDLGCDPEICWVIGNGIHYDRFKSIPLKKEDGWIDIGAVLRIAPIKDVKTLIYAFYELKLRVENVRLHIAGPVDDENYAKECHDLVKQLGVKDIIFPGMVNVLEYMEKFDFTMLTSISEGQPLSVLESFAAGRPCVTTDVGCCREIISGAGYDDFGSAGVCVPPMHREAICNAMELLCVNKEERLRMGQIGKLRVEHSFLHGDMMKKYREAYDEVFKRWQG